MTPSVTDRGWSLPAQRMRSNDTRRVAALDGAGCYGFEGSRVPLRATAPQTGAKYLK